MYVRNRKTYNINGNSGILRLKFTGLSLGMAGVALIFVLALNVGILLGLAYLFQMFWAWYMPVLWASAPMLDYWHSFASVVILHLFYSALKGRSGDD